MLRKSDSDRIAKALERLGTPIDVLRRHGVRVKGRLALCPFHDDGREPSLSTFIGHDGKWRWYCFGCEAKGDSLDLEARLSNKSLKDVL